MGWISNNNEHEGWAACVAPDGRLPSSSTGRRDALQGCHRPLQAGQDDERLGSNPGQRNYRLAGPVRMRLARRGVGTCYVPTAADFKHRRDYVSLDEFANASGQVEDAIHYEWKAHIAPSEAAAREYNQAGHRLDKTVAAAKVAGASWAEIGRAVGISRQSVHERWAERQ